MRLGIKVAVGRGKASRTASAPSTAPRLPTLTGEGLHARSATPQARSDPTGPAGARKSRRERIEGPLRGHEGRARGPLDGRRDHGLGALRALLRRALAG